MIREDTLRYRGSEMHMDKENMKKAEDKDKKWEGRGGR